MMRKMDWALLAILLLLLIQQTLIRERQNANTLRLMENAENVIKNGAVIRKCIGDLK